MMKPKHDNKVQVDSATKERAVRPKLLVRTGLKAGPFEHGG